MSNPVKSECEYPGYPAEIFDWIKDLDVQDLVVVDHLVFNKNVIAASLKILAVQVYDEMYKDPRAPLDVAKQYQELYSNLYPKSLLNTNIDDIEMWICKFRWLAVLTGGSALFADIKLPDFIKRSLTYSIHFEIWFTFFELWEGTPCVWSDDSEFIFGLLRNTELFGVISERTNF